MQRSWRNDADKLTFIVCTHPGEQYYTDFIKSPQALCVVPGQQDAPEWMIGDVNLFLYEDDEDEEENGSEDEDEGKPKSVVGELEIMIARKDQQGKGMAQETLRAFMSYIQSQLSDIGSEFARRKGMELKYLRVKIDKDNVRSLRLFERVGFVRTSAEPNYFGEVELRTPVVDEGLKDIESKIGLARFGRTIKYKVPGSPVAELISYKPELL